MTAVAHAPDLTLALVIALAGGLGALARTELNDAMAHRVASDFPFGILAVNVSGSFVLGFLTGLAMYHGLSSHTLFVAGVGFCGGFTTWSTAIWETLQLLRLRLYAQSAAYTLGGLALAVGAAALGIAAASLG